MVALSVIVGILTVVVLIYCGTRESKTTGLFKALKVYGRIKAYLFCDFAIVAIVMLVSVFFADLRKAGGYSILVALAGSVVFAALSAWIYLSAKKKCPVQLRGQLFKSMLISGFGVTAKIMVFIIPIVWNITMPRFEERVDERGNHVFVAEDGTVYSAGGENVGRMKDRDTYVPRKF